MVRLNKLKMFATQCGVTASSSTNPTSSPVIHLRRRKTLRMLFNCSSDRRQLHRSDNSPELRNVGDTTTVESGNGEIETGEKKEIRVSGKLKDLFVSSPPFEERKKSVKDDRKRALAATGSRGGEQFENRSMGLSVPLRLASSTFQCRLQRRVWRPFLVTIPE